MSSTVDVAISTETAKYAPDSPQWRREVAAFATDLSRETGSVTTRSTNVPGTKGGIAEVILALGTSGALVSAVQVFRAWLGRDKTRTITATWTDEDGKEQRFTLTGENIDQQSLTTLSESIGRMIEGR
ncbi:hypothetical protein O1R50_12665 [Glycomyces luteolus]|uniref:Uncharacterized protein n=1 Tax=Glycomyces luteolus TaxID=2670330 RepID=A0A9X3PB77_9ACTN|nr:hypothetical protein [Glycomyces luteolus]MDA1360482.1 hypothetical protein [Glycomyces luteolus]